MRIRHIKGAEEAVDAHPLVIRSPERYRGRWSGEVFQSSLPIRLEIGCGMGAFIRAMSKRSPDCAFIGLEINYTVLYKALRRLEREESAAGMIRDNLRFLRSDARFLCDYFAPGEISTIYLNFPDPWPKEKSANRRLTSPHFLSMYEEILSLQGQIEMKTDNSGLFEYSLRTLTERGWTIGALSYDLHHDEVLSAANVLTEYEAKFSGEGQPIFMLLALRP